MASIFEGRLLWRELIRGVHGYPEAYRTLWKAEGSAEEIAHDLFVPGMLVTG
jgi:hypothetical protein